MSQNKPGEATPQETVAELREMVTGYAKQETVEPLKALGHWLKWSLAGAVFLILGVSLMALGLLRLVQEEFGGLDGGNSWIPYLIAFVALVVVLGLAAVGLKRSIDVTDRSNS